MTLGVISRFPINIRRRGAVSARRDFPQGCGRSKFNSNSNPNQVSDVDLGTKGKDVDSVSALKNNDEPEKLSSEQLKISKNVVEEELSLEKSVNGKLEELCNVEEARDGHSKEEPSGLEKNMDESVEVCFDSMKNTDQKVGVEPIDSKMTTNHNVVEVVSVSDQTAEQKPFDSNMTTDHNAEKESFDSKIITNQNVGELTDSKVIVDHNCVKTFDSKKTADENVDEDPLGSKINTDENVEGAFDSETNTVENVKAFDSNLFANEHVEKETSASKENTDEYVDEMTSVSTKTIDEDVVEMLDSKKITDEKVKESPDSEKVTNGNVKESIDCKKNVVENVDEKFDSIRSVDDDDVEVSDSKKFPNGKMKSLQLVNGNVKAGPSHRNRPCFVKRTGQLSVIRHFPVGCGRNVSVENKGLSSVVEGMKTSECKFMEGELEAGAIVKYVCNDVKNIVKYCEDKNEDGETNHENEKGKSLIGEKMQSMEIEAPNPKKLKKEDNGNGKSKGVKVDLLRKKSSGAKLAVRKKFGKVVARKSAGNEAANIKRKSTDEELDDSLEDYTDKLFVQALTSSDVCPWKNDKKSGGIISNSAAPKFKRKKVSNSRTFFPTPHHRISVNNSVDDDVRRQHDGNDRALTIYNGPRDGCITMIPTVSSKFLGGSSSNKNKASSRSMVQRALRIYQILARKFLQEDEKSGGNSKGKTGYRRYDLEAAKTMKMNNEFVNYGEPNIGSVPGVEVGDEFHFRTELSVVGLHRPYQAGIDFAKIKGRQLALSVVASGGYPDDVDGSDVLIYTGSGGNPSTSKNAKAGDQTLERGNLALKNCIDAQSPVRVIYGVKESTKADAPDSRPKLVSTFTYDGLYLVERYWMETGKNDFSVYKFMLRRIPGQPEISLKEIMKVKNSRERVGVIANDISGGKESVRICAVNTIDNERPMPFNYINKMVYPSSYVPKPSAGCDCRNGCFDTEKCACAVKNGGSIPYNFNGAIVQAKVLVYECGPKCKCPASCYNKVSQFGIKLPLEIFKTATRGWGVRSLASIPSGTFICEYVGEMIDFEEAERRDNDEYLFDIGNNYDDHSLWEGLPSYIPGAHSSDNHESMDNGGFTIDAAKFGNVGRFINHSCTPNLFAQSVLYDHDEKKMPHIMFFAADNIPPLKELTYHYNYALDQVRDENGNIKRKDCFCGSSECTGRLY